jgi:glycosyltransferase involved in cell wall biosynthesis
MTIIPFLDKDDSSQRRQFSSLLLNSDFLLVPTRSECFGVVFCEASAFGLPSISTDTGGVSGVVSEGENGHLLPLSAAGEDYARLIAEIHCDEKRCLELSMSSRRVFEERLNWDTWGKTVGSLLKDVVNSDCRYCTR